MIRKNNTKIKRNHYNNINNGEIQSYLKEQFLKLSKKFD